MPANGSEDDVAATDRAERRPRRRTDGPPPLESTLVGYSDSPDRRTVYPPGLTSVERMSTWLTADESEFCSLERMR